MLTTITDKKYGVADPGNSSLIAYYEPDMVSATEYYPFGMPMRLATTSAAGQVAYRYGFNGHENDWEAKGWMNTMSAEHWMYDSRLGRRWNLDPKPTVGVSEYSAFFNNPIFYNDPLGDTSGVGTRIVGGVKALGGLLEMGVGAAGGVATSWTGVGAVIGGATVLHGADVTSAGFTQMWTGKETPTFTEKGIKKGLMLAGVSEGKAGIVAGYGDAGLSLLLSAGSGYAMPRDATFVAARPLVQTAQAETVAANSAAKTVGNLIPEGKLANHLFKGAGKLADNPANRTLIQNISNGKVLGVDAFGKSWYTGMDAVGKSIYSYTQNGVVKGAGYMNMTPEEMIIKYGLK